MKGEGRRGRVLLAFFSCASLRASRTCRRTLLAEGLGSSWVHVELQGACGHPKGERGKHHARFLSEVMGSIGNIRAENVALVGL